jgi:hypothetical protein
MEKSSAAQFLIAIVPNVGIVMSAIVAFFYLLWNHRRKVLLIKAGQPQQGNFDLLSFSLLAGLLLSSVGLGLTIFLALMMGRGYGLLGGIIPLTMGLGLLAYYVIKRGDRHT